MHEVSNSKCDNFIKLVENSRNGMKVAEVCHQIKKISYGPIRIKQIKNNKNKVTMDPRYKTK